MNLEVLTYIKGEIVSDEGLFSQAAEGSKVQNASSSWRAEPRKVSSLWEVLESYGGESHEALIADGQGISKGGNLRKKRCRHRWRRVIEENRDGDDERERVQMGTDERMRTMIKEKAGIEENGQEAHEGKV